MPIPDGREDAVKALSDREWWRGQMTADEIVALVADILRFSPLGDNHHNAAACPYCNPDYRARLAEALDEAEWPTVPDGIAGTEKAEPWIAGRDAAVKAAVRAAA